MPRSKSRSDHPARQPLREWVGGRMRAPFHVTDADPPYRPELVLWLELPDDLVVAMAVLDQHPEPKPLARVLREGLAKPLAGPPRRPQRIRVADQFDAAEVRAIAGPTIEVVVAPTPELTAVLESMAEGMDGGEEESYFEGGRVAPELVAELFAAGRVLHTVAPWNVAGEEQTLRMDIPALDVEGACVSIIGELGESAGILIFPSLVAFGTFADMASAGPPNDIPADLGTPILSFTFEQADELPPSMRREALRHGWPVAGPDAYPRVEHRDRDGMPRPLTERDVRIASAGALAIAAFTLRHGRIFSAGRFEPVSETSTGNDGVAVRLTAPYEAADLFDPDPTPSRATGGQGVSRPGRNAPCWCGSGRKYKRCHFASDQAANAAPQPGPSPIHAVDERLVFRMARFAARFGKNWLSDALRPFADPDAAMQLSMPWSVYHVPADGRPVVDWFLAEEGRRLSREERSWLEAQRSAWLGIWEVQTVTPGSYLDLRDLLTGAERRVLEVSGSGTLVARDAVLGRVVDHAGLSVFAGVHPRPLPPEDAASVVNAVRRRARRRHEIPWERLRDPTLERFLIKRWEDGVATMDARFGTPPILRNTDGDDLLLTTDHFGFDPSAHEAIAAALASIEELEGPDGEAGGQVYTFFRTENATGMMPGSTVLGRVRLTASRLTLETNSRARADRLRQRLQAACGERLRHRAREHTSLEAHAGSGDGNGEEHGAPSPEVEQAVHEWLEQYYGGWVDLPVPALDGMTPREAARTRDGRERLDVLLKDLENRSARQPLGGTPDVARIRAELGLES